MMRNPITLAPPALAIVLLTLSSLSAQQPQPPQPGPPLPPKPKIIPELPPFSKFSKTPEVIQRLQTEITTGEFQAPMHLSEALGLIDEQLAKKKKEIAFFFDEEAFKAEVPVVKENPLLVKPGKDEPKSLSEVMVRLPPLPKKMTVDMALRVLIGQLPRPHQPTYVVRGGTVVITPKNRVAMKYLLKEKVVATFHKKPLVEAVYSLSDLTGASIVFDPFVGEQALAPVSATFAHDATLDSALTLMAETVGLRVVVVGDGIYITTPQNADNVRYLPKN